MTPPVLGRRGSKRKKYRKKNKLLRTNEVITLRQRRREIGEVSPLRSREKKTHYGKRERNLLPRHASEIMLKNTISLCQKKGASSHPNSLKKSPETVRDGAGKRNITEKTRTTRRPTLSTEEKGAATKKPCWDPQGFFARTGSRADGAHRATSKARASITPPIPREATFRKRDGMIAGGKGQKMGRAGKSGFDALWGDLSRRSETEPQGD